MSIENIYNVTKWNVGDAHTDIGEVINDIIADIKRRQCETDFNDGGKPGAVIYIPPGDYHLSTQVVIDISFLRIEGAGHGFTSSSIRFNVPKDEWKNLHELWPGGSRILVDLKGDVNNDKAGAAFLVKRQGSPRISSVEFKDFCIDGLHFLDDGSGIPNPENTYRNGKTGILVESENDSFKINGMGCIYLEHGLVMNKSDAASVHDNFIAECGNCIEFKEWGQASKVTDNLIGAGFNGYSIFAENFGGLLISSNNVFPRGISSVTFRGVTRSIVTSNRFHSFYPGMLVLKDSSENMISSNHFLRDHEPWLPMLDYDNGMNDDYGLIVISGNHNTFTANHISENIAEQYVKPCGIKPVVIHMVSGVDNYVSDCHIVALSEESQAGHESDSCFSAQVDALLAAHDTKRLDVVKVLVEKESFANMILDIGTNEELEVDYKNNTVRNLNTVSSTI